MNINGLFNWNKPFNLIKIYTNSTLDCTENLHKN